MSEKDRSKNFQKSFNYETIQPAKVDLATQREHKGRRQPANDLPLEQQQKNTNWLLYGVIISLLLVSIGGVLLFNATNKADEDSKLYQLKQMFSDIGNLFETNFPSSSEEKEKPATNKSEASSKSNSVAKNKASKVTAGELTYKQFEIEQYKKQIEEIIGEIYDLKLQLQGKGVRYWGLTKMQSLDAKLAEADTFNQNNNYEAALQEYKNSKTAMQRLLQSADGVYEKALEEGNLALDNFNYDTALEKFNLAQHINDSEKVKLGLVRTKLLPSLIPEINKAKQLSNLKKYGEAIDQYKKVLEKDAINKFAQTEIERLTKLRDDERFDSLMQQAFAAKNSNELQKAAQGFQAALAIKPNNKSALEALGEIKNTLFSNEIAAMLSVASNFERSEKWSSAVSQYKKILAKTKSNNVQKRSRYANLRLDLENRIDNVLRNSTRLYDKVGLSQAESVVREASAYTSNSPGLRSKVNRLKTLMSQASTPTLITLVSDGLTDVTLLRHGHYGRFKQKIVSLTPGKYVAIGSRAGYRDVRVEFEIKPNQRSFRIAVNAKEKFSF